MSDLDDQLDRQVSDGKISLGDADQVREFRDFLIDAGPPGPPGERSERIVEAYRKHYPEEWALAVAEDQARRARAADEGTR